MTVLILNRTPAFRCRYKDWLKELNEDIVLITSNELIDGFKLSDFSESYAFENYTYNGCVELKVLELSNLNNINYIVASAERDLIRAGKLRDILNIKGQTFESAKSFRDKTLMKTLLQKENINVPKFSHVNDSVDVIDFINKNGYPVVVKPIDGAASVGVNLLHNEEDLYFFISKGLENNLEVEEFIEGEMYHVDGLIINGNISFVWPSKYINGCLSYKENTFLGSYMLEKKNCLTDKLVDFTKEVIKALPHPDNTAFHAEVFHTPDDRFVLCEIASRIGGGKIEECFQYTFNLNLRESMVKAQCNLLNPTLVNLGDPIEEYTGFILIPPMPGKIVSIKEISPPDWVIDYKYNVKLNEEYTTPTKSTDFIAWFIVRANNEEMLKKRIGAINNWFNFLVTWERENEVNDSIDSK